MSRKKDRRESTLGELRLRRQLVDFSLKMLRTDPEMSVDPRAPDAIRYYEEQAKTLDDRIRELDPQPSGPDVVVGMRPAMLFPRALKGN